MEVIIVFVAALSLFIAAFIAKRRFGLLGLALAAGSILSATWTYDISLIPSLLSIPSGILTTTIVSSLLILLPAILLLFHGYSYKSLLGRVIGASLFTILALAFLIEPISRVLLVEGVGASVYGLLASNRTIIIGVGLVLAVADLFMTKPVKMAEKHRKR